MFRRWTSLAKYPWTRANPRLNQEEYWTTETYRKQTDKFGFTLRRHCFDRSTFEVFLDIRIQTKIRSGKGHWYRRPNSRNIDDNSQEGAPIESNSTLIKSKNYRTKLQQQFWECLPVDTKQRTYKPLPPQYLTSRPHSHQSKHTKNDF